ncbi:MAG TPA: hypothetical protein VGB98_06710 [Pyrinomonadaceae bacterium]|jgi:outer membrane lipoprotein SlyB
MDELIKQVVERTGISESQAQTAVTTVLGFLQSRLPEPIAGQLDGLLGGAAGAAGGVVGGLAGSAGDILGGLGGMLGGKKE